MLGNDRGAPVGFSMAYALLLAPGLLVAGCSDDGPAGPGSGDAAHELILKGRLHAFSGEAQPIRPSNNPSLGDGEIEPDGRFSVTLLGLSAIGSELKGVDPDGGTVDMFRGFACPDEVYAEVGSDVGFAVVPALAYGMESSVVGLASGDLDILLPLPREQGVHVRWIFAEEPLDLDTECREGDARMDLRLEAGWNEVIIGVDRPETTWGHHQYTGTRPDEVSWRLGDI